MLSYRYVFALFQTSLHGSPPPSVDGNAEQTIPTFLTLYIFGFIYQLVLVWDALRLKNTIQVIGLCLYNMGLLMYAADQMTQINDAIRGLTAQYIDTSVWSEIKPFLIAIPCVIAVGTVAMSFVARKLYDEFAWTIYKHISADLKMKRRYLTYQVYTTSTRNFAVILTRASRSISPFLNSTFSSSSASPSSLSSWL